MFKACLRFCRLIYAVRRPNIMTTCLKPAQNTKVCCGIWHQDVSSRSLKSWKVWDQISASCCFSSRSFLPSLSHCSSRASVNPSPSNQLTSSPSLDHLWWILTSADQEAPTKAAVLKTLHLVFKYSRSDPSNPHSSPFSLLVTHQLWG